MLSSRYYSASRLGTNAKPRTAMIVDDEDDLYTGFNEVAPALDTRNLREDQEFQETLRTAGIGRKVPSRTGTGVSAFCYLDILKNPILVIKVQISEPIQFYKSISFCFLRRHNFLVELFGIAIKKIKIKMFTLL